MSENNQTNVKSEHTASIPSSNSKLNETEPLCSTPCSASSCSCDDIVEDLSGQFMEWFAMYAVKHESESIKINASVEFKCNDKKMSFRM